MQLNYMIICLAAVRPLLFCFLAYLLGTVPSFLAYLLLGSRAASSFVCLFSYVFLLIQLLCFRMSALLVFLLIQLVLSVHGPLWRGSLLWSGHLIFNFLLSCTLKGGLF